MKKEELFILILVIFILLLGLTILVGFILGKRGRKRFKELDQMEGHDFEYFCADLLEKRGYKDVEVTTGSRDYGIDILAQKEGITFAIQCKCYSTPVGVKAVQEAYAGRDYYDCMVGVVLTNQQFTAPAVEAAKKLKILLWDRTYLEGMMEEELWASKQR
ncbi:MAG: restriction endonuclease [Lachnospiraceae bacterium]|nr:restriction endonuclease [Lachnospiraceae bacterium]